ncbi:PREDICTED: uncharacterized protein LOC107098677 [Cyprinodon variegatus]|uniref:Uncharacterized LOC107098677 n=1 Tax=Cyprinodon variegatus TaxID=28743 RepID=A0A3Q2DHA1_CYPVA|nr:PREDICTED: uncharacterized protein LOC107098677 [Cyprinodon variegatus]
MESNLSELSSIEDESIYVQPHYKEAYRLAIYALLCGGTEAYHEYLRVEQISHFLSEEEIRFILENAELPVLDDDSGGPSDADRVTPSTYFPCESDEEVPELELGWPGVSREELDTSISLLFHPPRNNTPSIKEVVRKQIQEARRVIAIAMDVFTDVDIFKEIINAALRGVAVYILLDDSRVSSFLNMCNSLGINILDIKNLRLRTVEGEQYQCRSAVKFHGSMEQRFILLDCQTVLYGTYSYTWSFEKINLSMVLVVTGQLVSTFDEEFRRLYGRSRIPSALPSGSLLSTYPKSSQLSLNLYMKSRPTPKTRGGIHDRRNDAAVLNRGLSVQEMLHQSHLTDTGDLVRGQNYSGEPVKMNSMTRLRMGTRNLGVPVAQRQNRDVHQLNRASQQHLRHQTRYGADQNLIPYSSETSLHKWKMDAYFTESNMPPDVYVQSPMISPHSSQTGLDEYQSQLIQSRSMDIRSRIEEMRHKRLSLQGHADLRQSKESLWSMCSTTDKPQYMRPFHGKPRGVEMDPHTEISNGVNDSKLYIEADETEPMITDAKRSLSHSNIKMGTELRSGQMQNRHNLPLDRAQSDAELGLKLSDSTLKISNLISGSFRHSRVMESLSEIPEEREASNSRDAGIESVLGDNHDVRSTHERLLQRDYNDKARERYGFIQNRIDSPPPREGNTSAHISTEGSCPPVEPQRDPTKSQQKGSELQRMSPMRSPGNPHPTQNEKKVTRKERSLQRTSLKPENTLDSSHVLQMDHSKTSSLGRPIKTDRSAEKSNSQNSLSGPEKTKYPFSKLPQRSSKRKTMPSSDQDQGSRSTLDTEAVSASQVKKEKAYSRYEYLIGNENGSLDRTGRLADSSDVKVKSLSLNRRGDGIRTHQTQGGVDNKLGRLMQRMGNLINKNK